MKYKQAAFYFFSGTGNTYRTAKSMQEKSEELGVSASISSIGHGSKIDKSELSNETIIGIFTPTHAFTAIWSVIWFAIIAPFANGSSAFVIATRAGTKAWNLFIPGMEGTAGYLIALLLFIKGYKIRGVMGVDMPSNWIALHPGFNEKCSRLISQRAKPKCESFIVKVLNGKLHFGLASFICLAIGIWLAPVSLMYLIYAHFFLSKILFASNKCNNCGVCAMDCPTGAIRMLGKDKKRPFWSFRCDHCMRCMAYCPQKAIEAAWLWIIGINILAMLPFELYLAKLILGSVPEILENEKWKEVIHYPFIIIILLISSLLLFAISRNKIVNTILTKLTFTPYFRRYHELETKLGEMKNI